MYQHILIPIDGSDLSEKAIAHGVALARAHNAKITALHVTAPLHLSTLDSITVAQKVQQQDVQLDKELAMRHLEVAANAAKAAGVPCNTVHAVHDQPYQAIIDAAKSNRCDLIAMASHGRRGISAMVLGSETTKVLTHTTIPVLVLR
jgi:nucleotide-binding universal stress UspA family protein